MKKNKKKMLRELDFGDKIEYRDKVWKVMDSFYSNTDHRRCYKFQKGKEKIFVRSDSKFKVL